MDDISFGYLRMFPLGHFHRFPTFRKIVSFPDRDVGYFAQYVRYNEFKKILDNNSCEQVSKRDEQVQHSANRHRTVVLQAKSELEFSRAKDELHKLARTIRQRLVYRKVLLEIPDIAVATRTVMWELTIHGPRTVRFRKPKMSPMLCPQLLCRASITPVHSSSPVMNLEVVQPHKRILMAKVDLVVVFSFPQLLPLGGLAGYTCDFGGSQATDECDAWVSLNGPVRGHDIPVLSSGTLNSPAIVYCSLSRSHYLSLYDTVKNALQSLFAKAREINTKSIALPFPRYKKEVLTGEEWLSLVSEQAARSLQAGHALEKIVVSSSQDASENPTKDLNAALSSMMAEDTNSAAHQDGNLVFKITQAGPDEKPLFCDLPQASLILVAESQQDLEAGEVALRQALDDNIGTSNNPCNGINSSSVVEAWNNWQMDYKTHCTLAIDSTNHGRLLLRGGINDRKSAEDDLIKFIQELVDGNIGPSPVEPHASAGGKSSESVETIKADSITETPLSYDDLKDVISTKQARLRRVKIFLCGEYGAGKSSLIRALLGEEFIHNADSTEGVSITRTMASALPGMSTSMSNTAGPVFRRFAGVKELFADVAADVVQQMSRTNNPSEMCNIPEHRQHSTSGRERDPLSVPTASAAIATHSYPASYYVDTEHDLDVAVGSPDEDIDNLASPGITSQHPTAGVAWTPDILIGLGDDVIAKIQEIPRLPDEKMVESSRTCIEFWDCGGQLAMSSQQSICMDTTRAVFVLTFDASKSLSDLVKEEVFRHGGKDIPIPVLYQGMTHRDFLLMWLTIAALRHERTSADQEHAEVEKSDKTMVFIVATHIDMVKEPDAMMDELRKAVDSIQLSADCQHLEMLGPYFVDNRRPCDRVVPCSQVVELQQHLVESVESFDMDEIPLNRMKLELAMCELQSSAMALPSQQQSGKDGKRVSRMHIAFSEFEELARYVTNDSMSSDEVMATLQYYHELGAVICNEHKQPNKDSIVFLCAEWILQQIMKLIAIPLKDFRLPVNRRSQLPDLERLKKSGVLSSSLLNTLWEGVDVPVQDSLMQIMCHFDLAYEMKAETGQRDHHPAVQRLKERKRFCVPLCIVRHERVADLPKDVACILPTLVLKFTGPFFPPFIFNRVALHCVQALLARNLLTYLNVIKFTVQTAHHVRISWFQLGMFVDVHSSSESKDAAEFSHRLLQVIQQSLQQLQQKGFKGLRWHRAFHCRVCGSAHDATEYQGSSVRSSTTSQRLSLATGLIALEKETIDDIVKSKQKCDRLQIPCESCGYTRLPPRYIHFWIKARSDDGSSSAAGNPAASQASQLTTESLAMLGQALGKRKHTDESTDSAAVNVTNVKESTININFGAPATEAIRSMQQAPVQQAHPRHAGVMEKLDALRNSPVLQQCYEAFISFLPYCDGGSFFSKAQIRALQSGKPESGSEKPCDCLTSALHKWSSCEPDGIASLITILRDEECCDLPQPVKEAALSILCE